MPGGTIWKGIISFGDMQVPVKLHSAVKEERIEFHLLHQLDGVKLREDKAPRDVGRESDAKGAEP